jgi:C-terminal peptidase prc
MAASAGAGQELSGEAPVPDEGAEFARTWEVLLAISDGIQSGHISPPARQQVFLAAANELHRSVGKIPPRHLSKQVSTLTENNQFLEFLRGQWDSICRADGFNAERARAQAASGMANMGSPFATFVSSQELQVIKQLEENQYVGIGVVIKYDRQMPMITNAFFGGPAHQAGVRAGDWILSVDGWDTEGKPSDQAIQRLRGAKGTSVMITVRNENEDNERQYTMVRNVVPISTIQGSSQNADGQWQLAAPGADQIALLKVRSIVGSTAAELNQLATRIEREGFKGVVIDFRGVGDSDLHHTIMLADSLIPAADLGEVMSVDGTSAIRTRAEAGFQNLPLAVVADERVSGPLFMLLVGLKRARGAKIVGETITSEGFCSRSHELATGLGAIDGLPYAIYVPAFARDQNTFASNLNGTAASDAPLVLQADIRSPATESELSDVAVEQLQATWKE